MQWKHTGRLLRCLNPKKQKKQTNKKQIRIPLLMMRAVIPNGAKQWNLFYCTNQMSHLDLVTFNTEGEKKKAYIMC